MCIYIYINIFTEQNVYRFAPPDFSQMIESPTVEMAYAPYYHVFVTTQSNYRGTNVHILYVCICVSTTN